MNSGSLGFHIDPREELKNVRLIGKDIEKKEPPNSKKPPIDPPKKRQKPIGDPPAKKPSKRVVVF